MLLINSKILLKLRWANHFVFSVVGNDDGGPNSSIIFSIKDTKLYVPVASISKRQPKNINTSCQRI